MQDVGQRLLQSLGPVVIGEPQRVQLNGQSLFVASSVTALSARDVMARFEGYCREHSGGLARAVGRMPATYAGKLVPAELRDPAGWLTLKDGSDENTQQITCFARSDQGTLDAFIDRVGAFWNTGDLSQIGDFRYAIARRMASGKTHVLVMWTEGRFNLFDMFPENGDAPGTDPKNVPRPPESVRLLSGELPGHPYTVRVYESTRSPAAVLGFYDQKLTERGFSAESVWQESEEDAFATATPSYARAFTKDGNLLVISAITEPAFEKSTQVSVVEINGSASRAFAEKDSLTDRARGE
jgi:hypothetical protein